MSKRAKRIVLVFTITLIIVFLIIRWGYKHTCYRAIDDLDLVNLPDKAEVVYASRAHVSDVYWPHVRAEKVIYCENGSEYVEEFITQNNSSLALQNIKVWDMSGMSDMAIYDLDSLSEEEKDMILSGDPHKYVIITYQKKISWAPISWYMSGPVEKDGNAMWFFGKKENKTSEEVNTAEIYNELADLLRLPEENQGMTINVTRESVCNGDDEQKNCTLEYQENEMLSTFLRYKVADYLPYTSGLTIWAVYMGASESQPLSEREKSGKKAAFIHKIENRCSKVEIIGGDRLVSSFGADELYCAVYK